MTDTYYIKLIIRLFTDGLTKREAAKLAEWRQTRTDNEHLFSELEQAWRSTRPSRMPLPVNTETAWQELANQFTTENKPPNDKTFGSFEDGFKNVGWIWKAAAAVFLAVSTAVFLKYGGSKESDTQLTNIDSDNLVFRIDN